MKLSLSRSVKALTMSFAAVVIFSLGQGVARADGLFISGSTLGCLCADPAGAQASFSTGGLTFTNASFSGTATDLGLLLPFGHISFSGEPGALDGQPFSLLVTFNAPLGIGGSPQPVSTLITGRIDGSSDLLIINFDNDALPFTNVNDTNSFRLIMFDVFVQPGDQADLFALTLPNFEVHPVPEPATVLLLATGLAGVAGAARRRARRGRL